MTVTSAFHFPRLMHSSANTLPGLSFFFLGKVQFGRIVRDSWNSQKVSPLRSAQGQALSEAKGLSPYQGVVRLGREIVQCHPERSEGSVAIASQLLRSADPSRSEA
jgi:hypothetical protein